MGTICATLVEFEKSDLYYARVAVGDDSVKTNLVEVGCLELQHLVNTSSVDLVGGRTDFIRSTVSTSEGSTDELLAVLVKQIVGWQMSARRDLDQLCESVSDLSLR